MIPMPRPSLRYGECPMCGPSCWCERTLEEQLRANGASELAIAWRLLDCQGEAGSLRSR